MTTKPKTKSPIFEAVHETASDLHRLGFIDKRKMRKFDVLCLDPIPQYDSEKIRALRDHLHVVQLRQSEQEDRRRKEAHDSDRADRAELEAARPAE